LPERRDHNGIAGAAPPLPSISRVEEIEAAIDGLPPGEYRRIVQWFRVREQSRWDQQMDADSVSGKLDFLFNEAESQSAAGLLREWPSER
jgi:hypothetical protein